MTWNQCWPVWSTTSSTPASRSAADSGAALMNWGRFPTTVKTFTRQSLSRAAAARSARALRAAVLVGADVGPDVPWPAVDVPPRAEASAAAIDEERRGRRGPPVRVEVHRADTIASTARDATQHDVLDCASGDAADVVRIPDEPDHVVREERSLAHLQPPVPAAHPDRARVAVDSASAGEDRVVHDAHATRDPLRSLAADDDGDARPVAGHPRVGAAEHVVDDGDPVHAADEVELRRSAPVHAERVPFDQQPVPRPERDEILMSAALATDVTGQRPLEPVPAQCHVVAEETVDEVASPAVVEPVVDDPDVSRPVLEMEAVREQRRAVAAVAELAAPNRDALRFDHLQGGPVARPLRRHEHVMHIHVTRTAHA